MKLEDFPVSWRPYLFQTKNGWTMSTQPFPNGNMVYATAQAAYLLQPDSYRFYSQLSDGVLDFRVQKGLFSRFTTSVVNTAIDDYLAAACVAPGEIRDYGSTHGWIFDIFGNATLQQWLGRFPGFPPHVSNCCFQPMGFFGVIGWSAAIIYAAFQSLSDQDGWIQSHLMVLAYERNSVRGKTWLADLAVWIWRTRKPGTTSAIMAAYTGIATHPLVELWKPYN